MTSKVNAKDGVWREAHRKVQKTFSIPQDIKSMLDAHKNPSDAVSKILETHRLAVGDGKYDDIVEYERQRAALIVEEEVKKILPVVLRQVLGVATNRFIEESKDGSKTP